MILGRSLSKDLNGPDWTGRICWQRGLLTTEQHHSLRSDLIDLAEEIDGITND